MTDQGISTLTVQNETGETSAEKPVKQAKSKQVLDGPTHLYKHYGRDRKLLYVGISLSALQRLIQHRSDAEWFDQIHMIIVRKYPTRKAARAAELKLILDKNPPFNREKRPWSLGDHMVKTFGTYENWCEYVNDLNKMNVEAAFARSQERKNSQGF
jgi:hypothetical protein